MCTVCAKGGKPELRRGLAAALITTTIREQHPKSHHKGATSMQTCPALRRGLKLAFTRASLGLFLVIQRNPFSCHRVGKAQGHRERMFRMLYKHKGSWTNVHYNCLADVRLRVQCRKVASISERYAIFGILV